MAAQKARQKPPKGNHAKSPPPPPPSPSPLFVPCREKKERKKKRPKKINPVRFFSPRSTPAPLASAPRFPLDSSFFLAFFPLSTPPPLPFLSQPCPFRSTHYSCCRPTNQGEGDRECVKETEGKKKRVSAFR